VPWDRSGGVGSQRERLTHRAWVPPWVWREHLARYQFAGGYVHSKVVVECACGDGIGSKVLLSAGAVAVEGFDRSGAAVVEAAARCRSPIARFREADACALPVADRFADVYVAFETIEHIEDDRAFLNEAVRVLRPDGLFICSTPNRTVTNPGTAIGDRPWNRYHVREYRCEELLQRLGGAFEQVEYYGQRPVSRREVERLVAVGRRWSTRAAVTLRQVSKWPLLVCDPPGQYAVQPVPVTGDDGLEHEYLVAVCHRPKQALTTSGIAA